MRTTGEGAFELIKKRYNVAASRARDQMFVVHSFDRDIHLRPGDLRLRLLQHVADPLASLRTYQQEVGKTESPFEKSVLKMLTDAGYKVRTQWHVGYYRIDMVVEGGGKRLAVECDGDRYHPIEKLADDIERQTILERLGWQFVRIRGSAFYRDAESAMRPVFERLRELEIPQEADTDLPDTTDMTLVHELEELIARGDLDSSSDDVSSLEPSDSISQTDADATVPVFMATTQNEADTDPRSPFGLLKSLGGMTQLEHFLREFAKSQGFQRLGSCHFSFAVKDSVDKDMVPVGHSTLRTHDVIELDVLLTVSILDAETIEFTDVEVIPASKEIDFGYIEPDYSDEDPTHEKY